MAIVGGRRGKSVEAQVVRFLIISPHHLPRIVNAILSLQRLLDGSIQEGQGR